MLALTGIASVAVSFLGVQLGAVSSAVGEIVRLHNGHFGVYRATRPPWGQHLPELFIVGVVLFWVVALVRRRAAPQNEVGGGVPAPQGILLR